MVFKTVGVNVGLSFRITMKMKVKFSGWVFKSIAGNGGLSLSPYMELRAALRGRSLRLSVRVWVCL